MKRHSGIVAFMIPIIIMFVDEKIAKKTEKRKIRKAYRVACLCLYVYAVMCLTVLNRSLSDDRVLKLIPFWTYAHIHELEYRWEILQNINLFVPLGFLLAFSVRRRFGEVLLIGLLLSIIIEATQYLLGLGVCEFDDVFHNLLGTLIGYVYWKTSELLLQHKRDEEQI